MTLAQQAAELAALPVTPPWHARSRDWRAARLRDGALACMELAGAMLEAFGGAGQVAHDLILGAGADLMRQRRGLGERKSRPLP